MADLREAQRAKYEIGDFKSVTIDQALDRLVNIANVTISDKDLRRIKGLNRVRNQVAHFALLSDNNPLAIKATVAPAMEALLRFIERELAPGAPDEERRLISRTYRSVMEQVRTIEVMVRELLNSLKPAIAEADIPVVKCPECMQDTFLLEGKGRCLFCSYSPIGIVSAEAYVENVLGKSRYRAVKHGGERPVSNCHWCGEEALVHGLQATATVDAAHGCFECGYFGDYQDLERCTSCREWMSADRDGLTDVISTNCR
ncbi:hypothetical protein [Nonomuraea candida]|uniref:hypothetical protein n=1 Tax=Nonomuraea candida TaxID=359159 RepID=UPI0012F81FB0|nr:hypothetical protein [Nonomuraea candida]